MANSKLPALLLASLLIGACSSTDSNDNGSATASGDENTVENSAGNTVGTRSAAVSAVSISGESASYTFSVTVTSPDTGCDQYADWWEVLRADGSLVYRRILAHSHVTEQPFTRSGGPVDVTDNENIIVRAHMNSTGYGELIFSGSVAGGLTMDTIESTFMQELVFVDPLPADCAF